MAPSGEMTPPQKPKFVTPLMRLSASLSKATKRPSSEMDEDWKMPMLPAAGSVWSSLPSDATLTRSVTPVRRSWTKTSPLAFVSPLTRFDAKLWKATKRPPAEIDGVSDELLPSMLSDATLTRSVFGVQPATGFPFEAQRSRTKTSTVPFVSPLTRLVAKLVKATKRPSAEMDGVSDQLLPWLPSDAMPSRAVIRGRRSPTTTP